MNSKIKNYVDVLFRDIPNTKKAKELKEEILSNLNDHFEAHVAEGKSENQAYTESLADLGDVDELLKSLEPERDLKNRIDEFRKSRAKKTAVAIVLYIIGIALLIGFGGMGEFISGLDEDKMGLIGLILMLVCAAVATGLIIYANMCAPQDVKDYLSKGSGIIPDRKPRTTGNKSLDAFFRFYWLLALAIYLFISFRTGAWYITWIIWIIAAAIKEAVYCFTGVDSKNADSE
ncbi:MAG: hypothetical protein II563_06335 [Treponema sp.]|nr:hypothetical protein [Treponema sp.]MBQ2552441.1 hypothetical protein [Treponema sp.]MBQ5383732.1 hypothetical protein [Treponema sp.]